MANWQTSWPKSPVLKSAWVFKILNKFCLLASSSPTHYCNIFTLISLRMDYFCYTWVEWVFWFPQNLFYLCSEFTCQCTIALLNFFAISECCHWNSSPEWWISFPNRTFLFVYCPFMLWVIKLKTQLYL